MRDLLILFVHLIVTVARLARPGGLRSVVAESVLVRHQLLVLNRGRMGIVRNTLKGIRRTMGTAAVQKAAALTDDIRAMVAVTDSGLIGARDRAMILLGFAGAFRRSELVGLDVEDCAFSKDGLTVTLRRSKVDQEGVGRKVGIPYGSNPETCPVRTMQAWIESAAISSGPVFRSINRHGHVKAGRLSGIDA